LEQEWSGVARGAVTSHEIQGNHISMLQPPNVAALANILAEYLKVDQTAGLRSPSSELGHNRGGNGLRSTGAVAIAGEEQAKVDLGIREREVLVKSPVK
jgi:hypothetical protein